ncbi:MAG: hypothetical protein SGPRY_007644, partial [Prymnesium sp.]
VVICCPPSADNPPPNTVAVHCNTNERRVWVQRGSAAKKQILFSSTFDAVLSNASPSDCYASAAEPAVSLACEGKIGCLLCIGPASAMKEACVFGGGEGCGRGDESARVDSALASRVIREMVRRSQGQTLHLSVVQASSRLL